MSIGNNQLEETPEGNFKGEDVLSDIREQSMLLMIENKVPEKQAAEITETLVKKMRKDWGGMLIYFKKSIDLEDRDYTIFNEYNGKNRDELCRKYDISVQRLYQIIRAIRLIETARRQPDMFKTDDA